MNKNKNKIKEELRKFLYSLKDCISIDEARKRLEKIYPRKYSKRINKLKLTLSS